MFLFIIHIDRILINKLKKGMLNMQKLNNRILKIEEQSIKGITLIALVITIIVLLILAGASISMLTGENGILTRGTKSKE